MMPNHDDNLEKVKLFTGTAGVSPARSGNACFGLVEGIYRDAGAGETPAVPVKSLPHTAAFGSIRFVLCLFDRSIEFYSNILSFEKVSDVEMASEDYETLQTVFGIRIRVVRMQLGEELIDLTEYDDVIIADCGLPISNFM